MVQFETDPRPRRQPPIQSVLVHGEVRGEPVRLLWNDGMVSGDIHLLDRVRMHLEMSQPQREGLDARPDFTDPVEFMDALRFVFEDRLTFTIDPGDD